MSGIAPVVRHLLLCRDVRPGTGAAGRMDILGLLADGSLAAPGEYPVRIAEMCVVLLFTNGRGEGPVQLVMRDGDSGEPVWKSPELPLTLTGDPLRGRTITARVRNCPIPRPGLYWVQFCYNKEVLAQEPLLMR